ncbi:MULTISPECIES: arsenite efflux transporter metallochaperone ArsD [Christensenella]|jgi:hypothetical protein|uniref:arsenite efflux transporter metallochaperone ArsD n=1 Tax=Christensenella TaxID=990721 RepID=UPI000837976B|nr:MULTISPECIES: arsenite efflux transporter metallochaperone ArsD [Christensenella]
MKKMQIFEPAMCCETGLCGVSIDPELLRISTVVNTLKGNGIDIERFNLNSAPMEFVTNEVINKYINEQGPEGLPAVLLDGEIIMTGKYPTNEEFTKLLDLPEGLLKELDKEESGGCCCCGGDDNGSCC